MALTNIGIYDPLAAEAFHQVLKRAEGQRAENNFKKSVQQGQYPQRSAQSTLEDRHVYITESPEPSSSQGTLEPCS